MTCTTYSNTAKYNFEIKQGSTFIQNFNYLTYKKAAIDLSGYKARMQIRLDYSLPIITELTTENNRIELNNPTGRIRINIPPTITENFDFDVAVYDFEIYQDVYDEETEEWTDSYVNRLFEGTIRLNKEVTKVQND